MKNNIVNERDKNITKQKLLKSLEEIIIENGFDKIGVNAVAARADVAKTLIYRYFGSVDDMIIEYLSQNDFWADNIISFPKKENIREFIKNLFKEHLLQIKKDKVLRELYRWELTTNNNVIEKFRLKRESKNITYITIISQLLQCSQKEISTLTSILGSSITYMVLLSDNCPIYNGIDLQRDEGWIQISNYIDMLIDLWLNSIESK